VRRRGSGTTCLLIRFSTFVCVPMPVFVDGCRSNRSPVCCNLPEGGLTRDAGLVAADSCPRFYYLLVS
jgi:hypothetical protein